MYNTCAPLMSRIPLNQTSLDSYVYAVTLLHNICRGDCVRMLIGLNGTGFSRLPSHLFPLLAHTFWKMKTENRMPSCQTIFNACLLWFIFLGEQSVARYSLVILSTTAVQTSNIFKMICGFLAKQTSSYVHSQFVLAARV